MATIENQIVSALVMNIFYSRINDIPDLSDEDKRELLIVIIRNIRELASVDLFSENPDVDLLDEKIALIVGSSFS